MIYLNFVFLADLMHISRNQETAKIKKKLVLRTTQLTSRLLSNLRNSRTKKLPRHFSLEWRNARLMSLNCCSNKDGGLSLVIQKISSRLAPLKDFPIRQSRCSPAEIDDVFISATSRNFSAALILSHKFL